MDEMYGARDMLARAASLSTALAKLPDYAGAVFRGGDLDPALVAAYVPREFRAEAGFTSTTKDPAVTFPGNMQFHIFSRHAKDISSYSARPEESEVIIDKSAIFRVHSNEFDPQLQRQIVKLIHMTTGPGDENDPLWQLSREGRLAAESAFARLRQEMLAVPPDRRIRLDSDKFSGPIAEMIV